MRRIVFTKDGDKKLQERARLSADAKTIFDDGSTEAVSHLKTAENIVIPKKYISTTGGWSIANEE